MSTNIDDKKQTWWSRNKQKVFVIGGIVAVGTIATVGIALKTKGGSSIIVNHTLPLNDVCSSVSSLCNVSKVGERASDQTPSVMAKATDFILVDVPRYLRNLPKGQRHSLEKELEAQTLGIILDEGKTLVKPYSYPRSA